MASDSQGVALGFLITPRWGSGNPLGSRPYLSLGVGLRIRHFLSFATNMRRLVWSAHDDVQEFVGHENLFDNRLALKPFRHLRIGLGVRDGFGFARASRPGGTCWFFIYQHRR